MADVSLTAAEVSDLQRRLRLMSRPTARAVVEGLAEALDLRVVEKPRVLQVVVSDDDDIGDVSPDDPREAAYREQVQDDTPYGTIPVPENPSEDDIFEIAGRLAAQGDYTKLHLDGPPPPRDYGAEPIRGLGKIVQPQPKPPSEPSFFFKDNPVGVARRGESPAAAADFGPPPGVDLGDWLSARPEGPRDGASRHAELERLRASIKPPRRPRSSHR